MSFLGIGNLTRGFGHDGLMTGLHISIYSKSILILNVLVENSFEERNSYSEYLFDEVRNKHVSQEEIDQKIKVIIVCG